LRTKALPVMPIQNTCDMLGRPKLLVTDKHTRTQLYISVHTDRTSHLRSTHSVTGDRASSTFSNGISPFRNCNRGPNSE